jgi:hypothetical protein
MSSANRRPRYRPLGFIGEALAKWLCRPASHLAQSARTLNQRVVGSNPAAPTEPFNGLVRIGDGRSEKFYNRFYKLTFATRSHCQICADSRRKSRRRWRPSAIVNLRIRLMAADRHDHRVGLTEFAIVR